MPNHSPRPVTRGPDPATRPAAERYRIVGRIASGGMAEIYLARMEVPGGAPREVVLKRLLPELQGDHEFVQMFHDEARIASLLSHPNIVQIFELGELDGSLFIAMELLRGVNLRDLLARTHRTKRRVPIPIAVRIMCGALDGLAYAHAFTDARGRRLNVVHRDVSPQNIVVTYDGGVKLVDFGVAKAEGRLHQTRAGLIKGKFAYMAPEQVNGTPLDGRADLFALAEVFYELLLERHPFYASTDMEVLRTILEKDPPPPTDLDREFPPALAAIFLRALEKSPTHRFRHAGEMRDALEAFLVAARRPTTSAEVAKYIRELFADRTALEAAARQDHDDDLLIESLIAGRAEQLALADAGRAKLVPATRSSAEALTAPDEPTDRRSLPPPDEPPPPADLTPRDLVAADPASHDDDHRLAAGVRGLFDEGPPAAFEADAPAFEADAPTVTLGAVSPLERRVPEPRVASSPTTKAPAVSRRTLPAQLVFFTGLLALIGALAYAGVTFYVRTQTTTIAIASEPAGAAVLLDGHDTGATTPVTLPRLDIFPHSVELRLDGYRTAKAEVPATPGTHEVRIRLEPAPPRPEGASP